MKPKYILYVIVFLFVALVLFIANGADRDYWPTKEWRTSPPEEQGMNPKMLEKINSFVKEKFPDAESILVVRHGYIVFEEYYRGRKDDLKEMRSVTKSALSALIGIALKEGYLKSIDQKMIDFFPQYIGADLNPKVKDITIRHLLTMSSGLTDTVSPDMIKTILTSPLHNEPGQSFMYTSESAAVLSIILTKATGLKALDFGKKHLFEPLGIKQVLWSDKFLYTTKESLMYTIGDIGLRLSMRDWAKIGYLYLNEGQWEEKQIITPEWVEDTTRTQIKVVYPDGVYGYGFLWWIYPSESFSYWAVGWGGNYINIKKDLDIVVVASTGLSKGKEVGPLIIKDFVWSSVQ